MKIPQGIEMILYALILGICIALSRGGNKGIELHRSRAMLISASIGMIFSLVYIYVGSIKIDIQQLVSNAPYILIPALSVLITRPIIISAYQRGFPITTFGLIYPLFGMLFTALLGILFYNEVITTKQGLGIVFAICAVYFLK